MLMRKKENQVIQWGTILQDEPNFQGNIMYTVVSLDSLHESTVSGYGIWNKATDLFFYVFKFLI